MRTAATVLSIIHEHWSYAGTVTTPSMQDGQYDSWFRSRSLESLVRRKRSCGVRRGADRKVPARADNSLAAYSTLR
jgi:hypothetical protein